MVLILQYRYAKSLVLAFVFCGGVVLKWVFIYVLVAGVQGGASNTAEGTDSSVSVG